MATQKPARKETDWVEMLGAGQPSTNSSKLKKEKPEGMSGRGEKSQIQYFIDNARDIFFQIDLKGNYTFGNAAAERVMGYRLRELLRMNIMQLVVPKYHALVRERLRQRLAGSANEKSFEFEIKRKDGRLIWMEVSTTEVRNASGQTVAIQGVARDVTERKQVEVMLRKSEERLKLAQASAGAGIWDWDLPSGKLEWSKELYELFGLKPRTADMSFNVWRNTLLPEDRKSAENRIQEAISKKIPLDVEYRIKLPSSEIRWIKALGKTICDDANKPLRMLGICLDITQLKKAETALRDVSEFNHQVIDDANDGVIVYGRDLRYQVWNRSMEELTGFPAKEVIGKHPLELFPFLRETGLIKSLNKVLAGEEVPPQDFPYPKLKNGHNGWVSDSNSPLRNSEGKIIGAIGIVRNITDRKHNEQLLTSANRTLQVIRDCHEAMLRAKTEASLLRDICRIIVQTGGESMAWVGFAENNVRKTVRPVAATGGEDYLAFARITWANTRRGRGPVGTAIRTRQVSICHNTLTDPNFAPWRARARRQGFGSVIALPLLTDGECLGALCIYAPKPNTFDAAEQQLLSDLANDLAFGIGTIRLRVQRERLEHEILKSAEREQERIGRDLHDGLCQVLVGAKFRISYLKKITNGRLPEAAQEAAALESVLNHAIEQTRDLARCLNPLKITPEGLREALQKLANEIRGPHCVCHFSDLVKISDHHVAYHLFRIAQEAVQNALKHAGAKNISITLQRKAGCVALTIKDDGAGIPLNQKTTGAGLKNIRTRARLIGGTLEIRRRKHGGTAITCEFPPISTQGKRHGTRIR